MLKQYFCFC